jgi:hypothetical protein
MSHQPAQPAIELSGVYNEPVKYQSEQLFNLLDIDIAFS